MSESGAGPYNIGEAARQSNVVDQDGAALRIPGSAAKVGRTDAGYRQYSDKEVHTLVSSSARANWAFSMAEIAELLKLWQNKRRSARACARSPPTYRRTGSADRGTAVDERTLQHLVHCCHGDQRPDCPILDQLGDEVH
jgi:DNA-binding transcriptional MerR regulator